MASYYRLTGRPTIGPVFNLGASAHLPGICRVGCLCTFAGYLPGRLPLHICRVGCLCTFAGYLPGRSGVTINGRHTTPRAPSLHLPPPAPAYPAKWAEPFAARLHPPQKQSGGRGSLPPRRPGGPHLGSTEAHTTSPKVPTVVRPRRAPSPPAGPTIAAGLPPTGAVAAGSYPGT